MPPTRTEWSLDHDRCFVCGSRTCLECHEIANGPARQNALEEPATWLRLCNECHQGKHGLHSKGEWPLARALALKRMRDPEHYDRLAVLKLKGRAETAVTEEEVDEWVNKMRGD